MSCRFLYTHPTTTDPKQKQKQKKKKNIYIYIYFPQAKTNYDFRISAKTIELSFMRNYVILLKIYIYIPLFQTEDDR